ncbi:Uncharacterised protein [Escherichia coli]|uniref:Uncharacterized protein n=1 Tax=Escherichia coli TaxID=562 RepID=A0A376RCD7_ECOLX|nr:Uncharacterised protein [Escherichia coli]
MVRTEVQTNTHVYYRVACQRTCFQLFLDTFINGRMYSPGITPPLMSLMNS